jgi:hypothetical protein
VIEKHYTINDLSGLLSMSFERTRQLVKDEPGVLRFAPERSAGKRSRTMYRIPESVVERMLRRSAVPARIAPAPVTRQLGRVDLRAAS